MITKKELMLRLIELEAAVIDIEERLPKKKTAKKSAKKLTKKG